MLLLYVFKEFVEQSEHHVGHGNSRTVREMRHCASLILLTGQVNGPSQESGPWPSGPLQNRLGRQVAEILKGLNLDKVFFSQKLQTRCEDLEIEYN